MGGLAAARAAALSALLLMPACAGPSDEPSTVPREETSATDRVTPRPSASAEAEAAYQASVRRIGPELRQRLRFSHRPGCPVPLSDLRLVTLAYVGFDGATRTGELVVHEDHARGITEVFESLYDARWPIAKMRLVDDYRADDDASMAANNTSAYNCRRVAGSARWSEHAYGGAIDVNPVQNPYVTDGPVVPPDGQRFAAIDRTRGAPAPRGVIRAGDVVVRAFARIGWEWGGDWSSKKDYQHFSASGR